MIKGMDVSTLLQQERCNAKYFDGNGPEDVFDIFKRHGVNSIRLRLWNNPYDENGNPYGAGTNDFDTTAILAKRAKEHGMTWLLDFHYSDFWADPGKQNVPKAWKDKPSETLPVLVCEYTKDVLHRLKEMGIAPDMVQVGNEITNGCLWPYGNRHEGRPEDLREGENYFNPDLTKILNAGIRAVREILPDAEVMLHLDNGGNNTLYKEWFEGYFKTGGEDFDIIGLSYYPFWHGNFAALEKNMNDIAVRFKKDLIVAEVSTGFTMEDYAEYEKLGPDERKGYATKPELTANLDYPMTKDGQKEFMKKLVNIIEKTPNGRGKGYYYWEPAWIPVHGCGWATEAALLYTKEKGPCGNEWANQALFDYDGNTLPALKALP